ncbi:MAG: hypothetical protein M1820_003701 [Bogoriella megaspora]|nr:MAG: hypothetical protein M1820_003701 [Bogoriella megaspora]
MQRYDQDSRSSRQGGGDTYRPTARSRRDSVTPPGDRERERRTRSRSPRRQQSGETRRYRSRSPIRRNFSRRSDDYHYRYRDMPGDSYDLSYDDYRPNPTYTHRRGYYAHRDDYDEYETRQDTSRSRRQYRESSPTYASATHGDTHTNVGESQMLAEKGNEVSRMYSHMVLADWETAKPLLRDFETDERQFTRYLLVRELDQKCKEATFYTGVKKLCKDGSKPKAAGSGMNIASTTGIDNLGPPLDSIRRVYIIRDRRSNTSWTFGFVELRSVADVKSALEKFKAYRGSYTISSKNVEVSAAHSGVFMHARDKEPEHFTFIPANSNQRYVYKDTQAYASSHKELEDEMKAQEEAQLSTAQAQEASKAPTKVKKRKADVEQFAAPIKKTAPAPAPVQLQRWQQHHDELHGTARKDDNEESIESAVPPSNQVLSDAMDNVELEDDTQYDHDPFLVENFCDGEGEFTCYLCERWYESNQDLYDHVSNNKEHRELLKDPARTKQAGQFFQHFVTDCESTFAFAKNKGCALCEMCFPTLVRLVWHEWRPDSRHTENLQDPAKRRRALAFIRWHQLKWYKDNKNKAKVMKARNRKARALLAQAEEEAEAQRYHDRAAERRADNDRSSKEKEKSSSPEPVVESSVAKSLMSKMGYKEGEGLGASGQGMVAAIGQDLYAAGVGLGHEEGKVGDAVEEANKKTKDGYGDFVQRTKDNAKARYEKM